MELLESFIKVMIQKTISIKGYILNALCNINDEKRKGIVIKLLE